MKKGLILIVFLNLVFVFLISAEVRINEVELNPNDSCNDCTEWLELYTDAEVNLIGWKLVDASNNSFELNGTFNGYYVIENPGISLNNANEQIVLYNQNELIDETIIFSDPDNNNKTWQYCSEEWVFMNSTKESENSCEDNEKDNGNEGEDNGGNEEDLEISINIEFDEDKIINGEEFKIKVKAYNLKSQIYNFKIWIKEEDKETVISDRYGEDSNGKDVWKSSNYYIYNLFKGPGDKTESIKLRIRENNRDFKGDAEICFKINGVSESEDCESIEILEKEEEVNKSDTEEIKTIAKSNESTTLISGEVIKLRGLESKETITNNQKDINNNVVYESKNEKIKIYAIIGFAGLCLGLAILMIFKKIK